MRIGIPAETRQGETRVAATPETIKKLIAAGHKVTVQSGAGVAASLPDDAFAAVGAVVDFIKIRISEATGTSALSSQRQSSFKISVG